MKTTGEILRQAREKSGKSLRQLSRQTKIKEKFLQALEENDFASLPSFPTALGFARSFAQAVGEDGKFVGAVFRRDFPQGTPAQKNEEMSLVPRSFWTPRTTVLATVFLTLLVLGLYLGRQYFLFTGSPPLEITGVQVNGEKIEVRGHTVPAATVEINGKRVLVEDDGSFYYQSGIPENGTLEIQAASRAGKKTVLRKALN